MQSEPVVSEPLFYPPVELRRRESMTAKILYSAATSRQFGRGSRLQLYLQRDLGPVIRVILCRDGRAGEVVGRHVYKLEHYKTFPATTHRYRESDVKLIGSFPNPEVGDVYIPIKAVGQVAPAQLFLEITYGATTAG